LHYDFCLLNYYRDGADKINFHSDKEALGAYNVVVTVSLGESRKIVFKSKKKNDELKYDKVEVKLNNSDLLLMLGTCQEYWTHGIPRDNSKKNPRISLTFRLIGNM
jgi:alkylated DNA repair dioxygenase AlkB